MGYSRFPENVGSMINRGVELDLNSNIFDTKDLTWDINFNLTHFKNKVLELAPELNGQLIMVAVSIGKVNLCTNYIYLNMLV